MYISYFIYINLRNAFPLIQQNTHTNCGENIIKYVEKQF